MNPAQVKVLLDALEAVGEPVNPDDAADVVRWAKNPDAVRELLKHEPHVRYVDEEENSECPQCGTQTAAHGRETFPTGGPSRRYCRIAEAWRALGDPRGAEDIERAHEEALRENQRRRPPEARVTGQFTLSEGVIRPRLFDPPRVSAPPERPFRQVSRPPPMLVRVLNPHGVEITMPLDSAVPEGHTLMPARRSGSLPYLTPDAINRSRLHSDARGMEAVEAEAWATHLAWQQSLHPTHAP